MPTVLARSPSALLSFEGTGGSTVRPLLAGLLDSGSTSGNLCLTATAALCIVITAQSFRRPL